jgi:hypothetical protein
MGGGISGGTENYGGLGFWPRPSTSGSRQVDPFDRLILTLPNLLNCVVAIYLILIGLIGLNDIYHFMS